MCKSGLLTKFNMLLIVFGYEDVVVDIFNMFSQTAWQKCSYLLTILFTLH